MIGNHFPNCPHFCETQLFLKSANILTSSNWFIMIGVIAIHVVCCRFWSNFFRCNWGWSSSSPWPWFSWLQVSHDTGAKGWLDSPKWMFFWKTPKRPWPPPPSFFGNYIALFFAKVRKYALTCVNLQWNFLDWRWPPPLPPFLDIFSKIYDQNIPFWNQKNLQCNFLDWKWPPPPPTFGTFPKKHPFLHRRSSLICNAQQTF